MKIQNLPVQDDTTLKECVSDELLRQILLRRGVQTQGDVECSLRDLLHFKDLKDISAAASILSSCVLEDKRLLVVGDYDVDGLTGTALAVRVFRQLGMQHVSYHIPSRYDGGYGITNELVQQAHLDKIDIILTVDNGISCHEAVKLAQQFGIGVVITDHHDVLAQVPPALAVVNPKQADCHFASKNLCGAGVLFYVLLALRAQLRQQGFFEQHPALVLENYLDLVALGTIADMVLLDSNNRRLVKAGLRLIRRGQAQLGIAALIVLCKKNTHSINTQDISFDLCPRLNAAGRIILDNNPAIDLLLSDDSSQALQLAQQLEMCNRRRGDYEKVALAQARSDAQAYGDHPRSLVLYRPEWISGILGLVASKMKDSYGVPCFVFTKQDKTLIGSGRSIQGVSLSSLLSTLASENKNLILRFGGHAFAAGVTITEDGLEQFKQVLDAKLQIPQNIQEEMLFSDGNLKGKYLSVEFAKLLEQYEPWGHGFERPLFNSQFIILKSQIFSKAHLRLELESPEGNKLTAIKFMSTSKQRIMATGTPIEAIYNLGIDRHYGSEKLLLTIKDFDAI